MRRQPADEIPLIETLQPSAQAWNIAGRSGLKVTVPLVRIAFLREIYLHIHGEAPEIVRPCIRISTTCVEIHKKKKRWTTLISWEKLSLYFTVTFLLDGITFLVVAHFSVHKGNIQVYRFKRFILYIYVHDYEARNCHSIIYILYIVSIIHNPFFYVLLRITLLRITLKGRFFNHILETKDYLILP